MRFWIAAAAVSAALAAAPPAGAAHPATGQCGTISAGGANWTVESLALPCAPAVAATKLFAKAHLKGKRGSLVGTWKGGPKGYKCSVYYGFAGPVSGGECSKQGGSFSWNKVGM